MPRSTRPRRRMPGGSKRQPSAVQVQQTFAPISAFLDALLTGEVPCTDDGSPVMIIRAIAQWCEHSERPAGAEGYTS